MSRPPLPPPSLRQELGVPSDVTDTTMQDLLRPPLAEGPLPKMLSNTSGEPGNIDLYNRPIVQNPDGTSSTIRSKSFNFGGQEVLLPTVSDDGRIMTDKEAIDVFHKTGKHLGKFRTIDEANAAAQKIHLDQEKMGSKRFFPPPLPMHTPTPQYMFGSQNIGPTAIRAGTGVLGGVLQGVGGPLGALGGAATTALGEDLAQKAEIYEGIRESPDLSRVGVAGLAGAIPFPAMKTASPLMREAGQAAFNTALPVGMVATENLAEGRPQSVEELAAAGGLGLLTHGSMRGIGAGLGRLAPAGPRARVEVEGYPLEQALGPEAGAAVYHGTPHTWPPEPGYPAGRPSLEKVRTGTGGMAQGHGFYVAESPKVGEYYQTAADASPLLIDGIPIDDLLDDEPFRGLSRESFVNVIDTLEKVASGDMPMDVLAKVATGDLGIAYNLIKNAKQFGYSKGNLYTLDLPDPYIDKMLDWDKPMSQQTPAVKDALKGYPLSPSETGEQFYNSLVFTAKLENSDIAKFAKAHGITDAHEATSAYLLSKGIPGNKYLDAMSRNQDFVTDLKGEIKIIQQKLASGNLDKGTVDELKESLRLRENALKNAKTPKHNLVLFDPSIATPTHINDQPVPLSTLIGPQEDLTPDFTKADPNAPEGPFSAPMKEWPTQRTMESPASTFPMIKPVPSVTTRASMQDITGAPPPASVMAPTTQLPPDVRALGPWEGFGDTYNLKLPDGSETTFIVPKGGSFDEQLAQARLTFAKKLSQQRKP